MVYDGLLVLAVMMIVTACFLPLTGGEAVTWQSFPLLAVPYWAMLVGSIVVYFGLPWTQRGQTLGMATWRLRVQRDDGFLLTWRDVSCDWARACSRGCRRVSAGCGRCSIVSAVPGMTRFRTRGSLCCLRRGRLGSDRRTIRFSFRIAGRRHAIRKLNRIARSTRRA